MPKKGKSVSFDAMVRLFMHNYEIPTKRDVQKLIERLDRIEQLATAVRKSGTTRGKKSGSAKGVPAFDSVCDMIKKSKNGLNFSDIQAKTGYPDKKIRNIIFRLNKLNKIKRHARGVYVAA